MSGPKSSMVHVRSRRLRLLALLAEGRSQGECAGILQSEGFPASEKTVALDIKSFGALGTAEMSDSVQEYRASQLIELSELKAQLVNDRIKPEKSIELALAIIDREIDLLGTKAPTKTITARIDADVGPEQLVGYRRFVYETRGLDSNQVEEVYLLARGMQRPQTVEHTPPQESELWEEEGS